MTARAAGESSISEKLELTADNVEKVLDEVRPYLIADGGDVELVEADDDRVVLRTSGEAAFGAGSHYVRVSVIEPAIRKVVGADAEVVVELYAKTARALHDW